MKKNVLLTLFICLSMSLFAQLEVKQDGRINIGAAPPIDATLPLWQQDTLSTVKIFGPYGDMRAGGRISIGDVTYYNKNVLIGELGESGAIDDSDILWLQGKKGMYLTASPVAQDTICYYDQNKGNFFQFNCDVRTTGLFVASDNRFKENISPLDNTLNALNQISAVSYNLKPKFKGNGNERKNTRSASGAGSVKEIKDATFYANYYNNMQKDPVRYGFIAQEVKEVYPELVRTDSTGYMYVDYIGMIPILVNALNELKSELDEALQSTSAQNGNSRKNKNMAHSYLFEDNVTSPKLFQNSPNPFSSVTTIKFTLPESVQNAIICIYNMQGKQLKQIDIAERGDKSISIEGYDLEAGMYIYALIADGKEIDSKRMILTK